jgi:hypothetical protein
MKKYFLLIFALLISAASYAVEKLRGEIVFADRSEDVWLFVPVGLFGGDPDTEALQKGVRYLDANGKKKKLKPDQAKEFSFVYRDMKYRMVSHEYAYQMLFSGSHIFLLQIVDGPVKMFEHRVTSSRPTGPNGVGGMTTTTFNYLLQRGDEQLFEPRALAFKKDMIEYFSDCPKLVALIEGKEFKRRDFEEMVRYYNEQCDPNP